MSPGVVGEIGDEENLEREIEKQMGCMAGFLQLFDRHQILAGKRVYSARAPPSSTVAGSTSPSERSEASVSQRFPSPAASPEALPRPLLPLPVFNFKDGARTQWKLREGPRLSLDSRAIVDAKGKLRPREIRTTVVAAVNSAEEEEMERQRRSPSVVARLMGLDALPSASGADFSKPAELRRSVSESRVPRDPSYYRFVDPSSFQKFLPENCRSPDPVRVFQKQDSAPRTLHPPLQRKSCFDAQDFFPDPKRTGPITLYGEIERRLRMRGIDEPAKDLETLKQILEALQLKGLLHSKPSYREIDVRRNLVYDCDPYPNRRRSCGDSPIVVMKPAPKLLRRQVSEPAARRSNAVGAPPRNDRSSLRSTNERSRSPRSPETSSPVRRRSLINAESQRSPQPQRRISFVHSPKSSPKRLGQDPLAVRSPRNRRVTPDRVCSPAEDDISDSSISNSDFERSTTDDYKSGRSLLERCDKLLSSIAAVTAAEHVTAVDQQPSPVSVLDSSFLGDESSPSPATKRAIDDFKDQLVDWDEDQWSQEAKTVESDSFYDGPGSDDPDYLYVFEILRASGRCVSHPGAYAHLEKLQDHSPAPTWLHRRLLLDTVAEIVDGAAHVSPWDAFARAARPLSSHPSGRPLARHVWAKLCRIREPVAADDLNDVTCGAIRKDMAADLGWSHPAAELSDAVLQIERQIFKDLVADIIRDLADVASGPRLLSRRKLVF